MARIDWGWALLRAYLLAQAVACALVIGGVWR